MGLNIKDAETERLAAEVARITGESKTGAVRVALRERRDRLALHSPSPAAARGGLRRFLEQEAWLQIPAAAGAKPMTKRERERILGYGQAGV